MALPWPLLLFLSFAGVLVTVAWVALANKHRVFADAPRWARLGYVVLVAVVMGGICVSLLGQRS